MQKWILVTAVALSCCFLAGQSAAGLAPATPTFTKDIAPILYKNCASCHRPGEIAPMPLLTYAQVRPWARSIREKVLSGAMPPWHADAAAGTFRNERRLTPAEQTAIVDWVNAGAPEGDAKDLPALPKFPAGWTIGEPDAIVPLAQEFSVPASGEIPYQYFQAPTQFTEDKWIQAIEIRPGARSAVHHVLVYSRAPNATPRAAIFRNPNQLVARNGANNLGELIATTAPGTNAMVFPEGHALHIAAGSTLTFQVHYTANGTPVKDRTSIGFVFAKTPPAHEVITTSFINAAFVIPAGAEDYRVDSVIEFTRDAQILAIFPHTHLRGKSWEYRMVYPDGRTEVVLAAPHYDFNWQTYYEFAKPIAAPKGARLEGVAHYDNSANNKSNPNPNIAVRWGNQTWEEMQYTGLTLVAN